MSILPINGAWVQASDTLTRGATVTADSESPTGFTVTFVHYNPDAELVELSGNFMMRSHDDADDTTTFHPENYHSGLFPAGGFLTYMDDAGNGYWVYSLPLSGGTMTYHFYVTIGEERVRTRDVYNQMITRPVTPDGGIEESMIFVPWDSSLQHENNNRELERPRVDQQGEVIIKTYLASNGEQEWIGIYLPYGFDVNRAEPYPVVYLSHGMGGNELQWLTTGAVPQIMDNLIAENILEPTVIVTVDHNPFEFSGFHGPHPGPVRNLMHYVIPFVESNFNVSDRPEQRAAAGLSMGASVVTNLFYEYTTEFMYFGMFSGGGNAAEFDLVNLENKDVPTIMFGYGAFTPRESPPFLTMYLAFPAALDEAGIEYSYYPVMGAHDSHAWAQLFAIFAENYLWTTSFGAEITAIAYEEYSVQTSGLRLEIDNVFDQTMLPLRMIAEALGAEVDWDGDARVVTIFNDGQIVTLTIDEPLPNDMGVPIIVNSRTFVPIAFVLELFDIEISWDDSGIAIYIKY